VHFSLERFASVALIDRATGPLRVRALGQWRMLD